MAVMGLDYQSLLQDVYQQLVPQVFCQSVSPSVIHQVLEVSAVDVLFYVLCVFCFNVDHAVYVPGGTVVQGVLLYALPGYRVRDVGVKVCRQCACGHLLEQGLCLVLSGGRYPFPCYLTVAGIQVYARELSAQFSTRHSSRA